MKKLLIPLLIIGYYAGIITWSLNAPKPSPAIEIFWFGVVGVTVTVVSGITIFALYKLERSDR